MDRLTLVKWTILGAIAVLVIVAALGTVYLWYAWPTSSGPGVATSTPQEQAVASSSSSLNASVQALLRSEEQAEATTSLPVLQKSQSALEQAEHANHSSANTGGGPSAATQAQLQASQNALQQAEAQQKVQEQ